MTWHKHLGETFNVIYCDQQGYLSQRKVKVHSTNGEQLKVFCYTRNAIRSLTIANILSFSRVGSGLVG